MVQKELDCLFLVYLTDFFKITNSFFFIQRVIKLISCVFKINVSGFIASIN